MKLPKRYDSDKAEEKWQEFWEKKEIYKFDPKGKKPVYSIDTPPPTVSGEMHIGHAYSYSQMDIIARYRRMAGYNVFYPFGTDDNGLPTERLIERKKGVRHQDMERDEFTKFCLKVLKEELRPEYIQEWKNIGISADYDLFYTTINEHCRRISQESFLDLYDKDRIYRKEDPTIWCPKCHMALAQVELEDKELESEFADLIFKLEDGSDLIIATTRPELLSSCVAIFVHPEDEKNKELVGKKAVVPLFNQKVPILEDKRVDKEKGTGVVMCCTFGDQTDIEWYRAHDLPLKMSITEDGKMSELAGKYEGLKIKEARKKIIEDLEEKGLIKGRKKITHTVNVHERCGTDIEILHTTQWFIKYLDLKNKLLKAGREMNWYPEHMINRYTNWIEGLQWDWCISRQRFFGVPIPVWYCKKCGEPVLPDKEKLPIDPLKDKPDKKCKCGSSDFEPEEDILDTWATSSMTPQIAAELVPDRYEDIYPMSLRPQAHDIITFWLFNTVVKSQLHNDKNPFEDIMISGWALDPNGKKMSKSKGNVVDPKKMIEKYSVDALRFWAAGSSLGEDLPFKEKDLATAEKFSNKMWNASKFALMHLENYEENEPDKLRIVDKWMLSKLNNLIRSVTDSLEKYEYVQLKRQTEDFFWHDFCDNYLEIVKDRLYNPDKYELGKEPAQYVLYQTVLNSLKLMAPVMPYITEEIYHLYADCAASQVARPSAGISIPSNRQKGASRRKTPSASGTPVT
ncbi:MAG: valine--tRNA ligase [Candidatus Undinarchaeales archaeon]